MKCTTILSNGKELEGQLLKSNFHTVLMRVYCPEKKEFKIAKRHKRRHRVNILS